MAEWVEKTLPTMGAGWCPPGMLGIGIGGTAEKAAVMAKESLMDPVDIHELMERGAETTEEKLRLEIFERANKLGIGAQGLGGHRFDIAYATPRNGNLRNHYEYNPSARLYR